MCNEIIRENISVEFLNINKKEAKKLKIKEEKFNQLIIDFAGDEERARGRGFRRHDDL